MSEVTLTISKVDCVVIRMALDAEISKISDDISAMIAVPYDERDDDYQMFFDRLTAARRRRMEIVDMVSSAVRLPENPYLNR